MAKAIVRALLNAESVETTVSVDAGLSLERQQKQVIHQATEFIAPQHNALPLNEGETAVDYATRLGYTKFEYNYEVDGQPVIVDVLNPAKAR